MNPSFDDINRWRAKPNCLVAPRLAQMYYGPAMTSGSLKPGFLIRALALVGEPGAGGLDTPVTPNALPEVQSLMACFSEICGKKILSGQREGWRGTNILGFELAHITHTTGRLSAVVGLDRAGFTQLCVGWRLLDGVIEQPIPGARLAPPR